MLPYAPLVPFLHCVNGIEGGSSASPLFPVCCWPSGFCTGKGGMVDVAGEQLDLHRFLLPLTSTWETKACKWAPTLCFQLPPHLAEGVWVGTAQQSHATAPSRWRREAGSEACLKEGGLFGCLGFFYYIIPASKRQVTVTQLQWVVLKASRKPLPSKRSNVLLSQSIAAEQRKWGTRVI